MQEALPDLVPLAHAGHRGRPAGW